MRIDKPYILLLGLLVLLTGCSEDNAAGLLDDNTTVEADLMFGVSLPQEGVTRQSTVVTQTNRKFRGLSAIYVIPFAVTRKVELNDQPKAFIIKGLGTQTSSHFFYYPKCSFMTGVASALCYAVAPKAEYATKAENGSLVFKVDDQMHPSSISFSPDVIYTEPASEIPEQAYILADYMTDIANAETDELSWSTVNDGAFQGAFQNFIAKGTGLLPGSYPSVKQHVNAIIDYLDKFTFEESQQLQDLREAIRERIADVPDGFDTDVAGGDYYPANIGLPDGAAVLRWMGSGFVPQTQRTSVADINSIDRFCYPAELYYYANSRLMMKNDTVTLKDYQSASTWEQVLGNYDRNGTVSPDTRAVAVIDPLQYGVACLRILLNPVATNLPDAKGNELQVTKDGKPSFPLTGIVVSGQREVNFNFMPSTTSESDDYFVYDNQVSGVYMDPLMTQGPTYTLLLQSPAAMKINLLLEFRNDSGQDFYGRNGDVIYNGTKFYLAGVINPADKDKNGEIRAQAFTQDEFTTVNATINTLENAYNVMPNLMNPRMELGIELTPKWQLTEPTNVELF